MLRTSAINLVLKIGLAVSGIAFAILSFIIAPNIIVLYPKFAISILGEVPTLALGAATAFILSIWLLSRKHKFASAFTFFIFVTLGIVFNLTSLSFISIAWPLFCMSLALCLRYYPRVRVIFSDKKGNEKMKIVPAILADEVDDMREMSKTENESSGAEAELYGKEEAFEENTSGNDFAHKFAAPAKAFASDPLATPVTTFRDFRAQFDHPEDIEHGLGTMPEEEILNTTYESAPAGTELASEPYQSPSTDTSDNIVEELKPVKNKSPRISRAKPKIKLTKAPRIKAIKHKEDDIISYDESEPVTVPPEIDTEHIDTSLPVKTKRGRKPKPKHVTESDFAV